MMQVLVLTHPSWEQWWIDGMHERASEGNVAWVYENARKMANFKFTKDMIQSLEDNEHNYVEYDDGVDRCV